MLNWLSKFQYISRFYAWIVDIDQVKREIHPPFLFNKGSQIVQQQYKCELKIIFKNKMGEKVHKSPLSKSIVSYFSNSVYNAGIHSNKVLITSLFVFMTDQNATV